MLLPTKFFLLGFGLLMNTIAMAQDAFITTWKTDNPGETNNTSIKIPTSGSGFNYDIDWNNDGVYDQTGITGTITHDFGSTGTYTIRIKGNFPNIYFAGANDAQKLIAIEQWGTGIWNTMYRAFEGANNLVINATDAPNLSQVTNMSSMFQGAHNLNQNINHWNTSNVTNMYRTFFDARTFNQPLSSWNTSNVTNMEGMFANAYEFNQPIGNWNTIKVTNMSNMFSQARKFNQPLNNWNTAAVTNMRSMFTSAEVFNQDLNAWNTSNVVVMTNMFSMAYDFNGAIGNWNTANTVYMNNMFGNAQKFDQPIGNWNTTKVQDMSVMFYNAFAFNQNLSTWNVEAVNNFSNMFIGATLDTSNYDALLIAWDNQNLLANKSFHGGNSKYCSEAAQTARQNMISSDNWTIVDGGPCQALSIDENLNTETIQFIPNPVTDKLQISFNNSISIKELQLFNVLGKQVMHKKSNFNKINMSLFAKGIYFLRVNTNQGTITKKIIKH